MDKLEFNPDWDTLEATQEALREHMRELNRLHDLAKDIIWEGACECAKGGKLGKGMITNYICTICNGTGSITRQATLEEVLGNLPALIDLAERCDLVGRIVRKVNNGQLQIKGE